MRLHIVTSYFVAKPIAGSVSLAGDAYAQRQREYVHCLHRNTAHDDVQSVSLLVEGGDAYAHLRRHVLHTTPRDDGDSSRRHSATATAAAAASSSPRLPAFAAAQQRKLVPVTRLHTAAMPTYADLFVFANQMLPRGALAMVCNADVYVHPRCAFAATAQRLFDTAAAAAAATAQHSSTTTTMTDATPACRRCTISAAHTATRPLHGQRRRRLALALTRHESEAEHDAPLARDYRGSHDAFVFQVPMAAEVVARTAHCQNSYQAENVVLYELQRAGYTVVNPCYDVRLVHLHAADVRQWLPSVAGTQRYARAAPVTLARALDAFA